MNDVNILVITGSTRPVRIGDQIASQIAAVVGGLEAATASVEDLTVRSLPLLDEPQPPALGAYVHQHSTDWSGTVARADAVVFVTPEYNAGYPAALKNAIDYLFTEWQGKPALVVSYGSHGGSRVQKQLSEVAASLRMRLTPGVELSVTRADYDATGRLADPRATLAPYRETLRTALTALIGLATAAAPAADLRAAA